MKKLNQIACLMGFALLLLSSAAGAATVSITCPTPQPIGPNLNRLSPGDTLQVSGACSENMVIEAEIERITLDGQGTATINGPDPNSPTVLVRGQGITIKGFTVTGGSSGIVVRSSASATIDGNTIQNTGLNGIVVNRNSFAEITNNTIQMNPNNGILVTEASSARIGFTGPPGARVPAPNTIQTNSGHGVLVSRSSSARILSNTISNNTSNGVQVSRASHADIASNTLSGNLDGIGIAENSGVNLGEDTTVDPVEDDPNTGSNSRNGVRCRINSHANGRLGALTGTTAAKDFDGSCIDSLNP